MLRTISLIVLLCAACSRSPVPWPDARAFPVAGAGGERLELRHVPEPGTDARIKLVLMQGAGEHELADQRVPLTSRDALWASKFALAIEPSPGARRAISWDGTETYAAVLALPDGTLRFCPHERVPALGGMPDWAKLPSLEKWAVNVLETAAWGCDESGVRCSASSRTGAAVHQSNPETDLFHVSHQAEMREVLANIDALKLDRPLAAALFDAAVTYQHGLARADLEKLGRLAAKAIGPEGPLTPEERKALGLRVLLARDEVKKTPKDQLSPRASVDALREALAE